MRLRVFYLFFILIIFITPAFSIEDTIEKNMDPEEIELKIEKTPVIDETTDVQKEPKLKLEISKEFENLLNNGLSLKLNGKIIKEIRLGGAFQGELDYDTYQGESGGHVQYFIPVGDVYLLTKFSDKHETEAKFMINPARTLPYGSYFPGILQDVYVASKPTKNTRILIGNSRTPIGYEGGLSAYTTSFVMRSQIARTFGDTRSLGVKLTGNYKWADYNVGVYDSSRYFYDMFNGAEFTGWVNFRPIANLDPDKYGSLLVGTGYNFGKRYTDFSVWGAFAEYNYKKLTLNIEYALANGYNGRQNSGTKADGFYTTLIYKIHPKVDLLARYDLFNPDKDIKNNNRTEITTGITYYAFGEKLVFLLNYAFKMYEQERNSNALYFLTQFLL